MNVTMELQEIRARLNRVVAYLQLNPKSCDTLAVDDPVASQVRHIVEQVARKNRLTPRQLMGHTKVMEIVIPRMLAIYLARKITGAGYSRIGRLIHRDHGTVIHAVNAIQNRIDTEPAFAASVNAWLQHLKPQDDSKTIKLNTSTP